jgi:hypothetical protein
MGCFGIGVWRLAVAEIVSYLVEIVYLNVN